jgi:molybdopterin synthase catalytic subunit
MYCEVTSSAIDLQSLLERVRSDADGAIVLFCGVVRNHDEGRAVVGLTYESYEGMAVAKLREICEEVASQFEVGDIAVTHRVGTLGLGEASVGIAVAAPHRDAAYKASREVVERLKREVPIWKREHYADGADAWLTGVEPPPPGSV